MKSFNSGRSLSGSSTRYLPDWQARIQPPDEYRRPGYRWRDHREAAVLCLVAIQSEAEVQQHLGDAGPVMAATGFHPWVWEAARPAWEASLYEDAVDAAARNLNSRLRWVTCAPATPR